MIAKKTFTLLLKLCFMLAAIRRLRIGILGAIAPVNDAHRPTHGALAALKKQWLFTRRN